MGEYPEDEQVQPLLQDRGGGVQTRAVTPGREGVKEKDSLVGPEVLVYHIVYSYGEPSLEVALRC